MSITSPHSSPTSPSRSSNPSAVVIDTVGTNGGAICRMLMERGINATPDSNMVNRNQHDIAVIVTRNASAIESLSKNACGPTALVLDDSQGITDANELASLALGGADAVLTLAEGERFAEHLTESIAAISHGQTLMRPDVARVVTDHARGRMGTPRSDEMALTRREIEILQCVGRGETVRKTAASLGISAKTVENLQSRMFRKLNVKDRSQAYDRAKALGLLRNA